MIDCSASKWPGYEQTKKNLIVGDFGKPQKKSF